MVHTLKTLCILNLRLNCNMNQVKDRLKVLPHKLLLKLALYLSPYGLQILQKYTSITEKKMRYFWLPTLKYPALNSPKHRRRFQIQIKSEDINEHSITDEEFFCNSLLHCIVDNIYTDPNISQCHVMAWLYYVHYPQLIKHAKDDAVPMDDLYHFLQRISVGITEITVTAVCANFIVKNIDIFTPCLRSVTKLNINLFSGSTGDVSGIKDLIDFTRKHRLCNVRLVSYTSKVSLQGFETVWDSIYKKRNDNIMSDYRETTELRCSEVDDFLDSGFEPKTKYAKLSSDYDELSYTSLNPGPEYDVSNLNYVQPGPEGECDLYDCVFEPFHKTAVVDTNVVHLEIILPQSDVYNTAILPALRGWRNLQSLTLQSVVIDENSFKGICKTLRYSLRELELQDFDCMRHETALLNLASKEDRLSMLEKLSLHYCSINENFFEKLLDESMEDLDACLSCQRLRFLDITTESLLSSKLITGLLNNKTLKHLNIKFTSFWDREFEDLFWAVAEHPSLLSFDVSSSATKTTAFGLRKPMELHGILHNTNIKQLAITSCFHSAGIHSVFNKDLEWSYTTNNVEVLILRDNSIDNDGLQRIGEILRDKTQFPKLRQLDLSSNLFDDKALMNFVLQLKHGCRYFERLAIFGYNLKAKGETLAKMEAKLRGHCHILISSLSTISVRDTADFASVM